MESPPTNRVEVVISARTLLALLAFGVVIALAILSLGTLLAILVASIVALGLDPIVNRLVARGWGRGKAALVIFAAILIGVVTLVVTAVQPLWEAVVEFVDNFPEYWQQISQNAPLDQLLPDKTKGSVQASLSDLVGEVPTAANTILGFAGGAFSSVLSVVTLTFLALFVLVERPAITEYLFGFAPPEVEARWRPVLENSISAVSSSLLGNVAISLVAGTVAGLSAWAFGLPFPVVLAVIAALLDLIPQVGATVAAVVLVLAALTVSTPVAIAIAVIQIIYQQVENYIVYPIVYREAVSLSPLTTILVVLLLGSLLGVVGAIIAVPVAAVCKVIIDEAGRPRRERMAAMRAAPSE